MPARQHEAIAVRPDRILRVVAQRVLPQRVGHRRERHRRARVARVRLLHGVHRERADRVDGEEIDRRWSRVHGLRLECGFRVRGLSVGGVCGSRILPLGPRSSEVLDSGRRQRGPAGLVARAQAAAVVAVEVLVEQHQVAPVRILGVARARRRGRAAARSRRGGRGRERARELARPPAGSSCGRSPSGTRPSACRRRSGGSAPAPRSAGSSPGTTPARASSSCRRRARSSTRPARSRRGTPPPPTGARRAARRAPATASACRAARGTRSRRARSAARAPAARATGSPAGGVRPPPSRLHVGDVVREVAAVLEEPVHALLEARQAIDDVVLEHLDREQRQQPDHRAHAQRHAPVPVQHASGRSRSRPPRPTGPCRRACSSRRRSRRSARRTSTPCPRRPDLLARQLQRHRQHRARSRTPSTPCRRPARGARRSAAAASGRTRRCCRARGSRRRTGCCPSASLRFTHQVKLISSFWNTRARKARSRPPARRRSSCRRASTPRRAPAGSRRRTRTRRPASARSGACTTRAAAAASCSFANCGIDPRKRDHVERQIPRREPRVLPLVRHRDHVAVVEVPPVAVAAPLARSGGGGGCAGSPSSQARTT